MLALPPGRGGAPVLSVARHRLGPAMFALSEPPAAPQPTDAPKRRTDPDELLSGLNDPQRAAVGMRKERESLGGS